MAFVCNVLWTRSGRVFPPRARCRSVRVSVGRRRTVLRVSSVASGHAESPSAPLDREPEEELTEGQIVEEAKRLIEKGGSDGVREALMISRRISPGNGLRLLMQVLDDCEDEILEATATVMLGQVAGNDRKIRELCANELLRRLTSSDFASGVRSAAATGLGELRDPGSLDALRRAYLEDTEWTVRYSVLTALGNLGDRKAVPILIDALRCPAIMLAQTAVSALGEIGDANAVPHLLRLAETESDMMTQQSLAIALGRFVNEPGVHKALTRMAAGDNPLIADAAEEALRCGDFEEKEGPRELETANDDNLDVTIRGMFEQDFRQKFRSQREAPYGIDSEEVQAELRELSRARRAEYFELCDQLKAGSTSAAEERTIAAIRLRAFPTLLKESAVLEAKSLSDPSQRVRASSLNLVSQNTNTLASVLLGDPDQNVRASACSALIECGETEAGAQALMTAFQNDPDWIVRVSAAITLGFYARNDHRAFDLLLHSLTSRDGLSFIPGLGEPEARTIQSHVITSLGFVGSTDALPALKAMTKCTSPTIRQRIASALGFIRHVQSLDILNDLVTDEDEEVRTAAVASREKLLENGL